jgi:hypothetical protein
MNAEKQPVRTLPSYFDPAVLAAFTGCVGRFREISRRTGTRPEGGR